MAKKTFTQLLDDFLGTDPYTQWTNLLDSLEHKDDALTSADTFLKSEHASNADAGTGFALHVSKGGDAGGVGSKVDPLLTVQAALDLVDDSIKTIYVWPGTYAEHLTWPSKSDVRIVAMGKRGAVTINGVNAGTGTIKFAPGSDLGEIVDIYLEGVSIQHAGTGLGINNSGMGSAVRVHLDEVDFVKSGGTSVIVASNGSAAIELHINGQNNEIPGLVYVDIGDAADAIKAHGVLFSGGLETTATDVAAEITLNFCGVKHEGVAGGHATQVFNAINCYSKTGETYAMLDTNDLGGSHTENLIPDPGTAWTAQV